MANRKVTVMKNMVIHEGRVYKVGEELTLSDAQINGLGDIVEASGSDDAKQGEKNDGKDKGKTDGKADGKADE